jgi:hypothetical protein
METVTERGKRTALGNHPVKNDERAMPGPRRHVAPGAPGRGLERTAQIHRVMAGRAGSCPPLEEGITPFVA